MVVRCTAQLQRRTSSSPPCSGHAVRLLLVMGARITATCKETRETRSRHASAPLCCRLLLPRRLSGLFAAQLACFEYSPAKASTLRWMLPSPPVCLTQRTPFFARDGVSLKHRGPPPAIVRAKQGSRQQLPELVRYCRISHPPHCSILPPLSRGIRCSASARIFKAGGPKAMIRCSHGIQLGTRQSAWR